MKNNKAILLSILAVLVGILSFDLLPKDIAFYITTSLAVGIVAFKGDSFLGGENMSLGPCNVYFSPSNRTLTGTIANVSTALTGTGELIAGTDTSTLTGTGTAFTTELAAGDWVRVGATQWAKIKTITSDTAAVVYGAYTVASGASLYESLITVTGTGTKFTDEISVGDYIYVENNGFAKVATITSDTSLTITNKNMLRATAASVPKIAVAMGGTTESTLKYSVKKAELKESQYGESAADRVVTGGECSVEMGLTRATLERMLATIQGFYAVQYSDNTFGAYAWGISLGEADSSIAGRLSLVRIIGTGESTVESDILHFPKAAPTAEIEKKNDAATQHTVKEMFNVYRSAAHVKDGKELFFFSEGMTF